MLCSVCIVRREAQCDCAWEVLSVSSCRFPLYSTEFKLFCPGKIFM